MLLLFPALASVVTTAVGAEGPCDITGAAGNPCVAAHSTVRALYGKYDGGLYIVQKNDTKEQLTIGVLEPGGFADKARHDTFCGPRMDCVILSVLDQSPMKNHLTQRHGLINASRHPIIVGDNVGVYGMWCVSSALRKFTLSVCFFFCQSVRLSSVCAAPRLWVVAAVTAAGAVATKV